MTRRIRVAKGRLGVIKSVEGFRTTPTIARSTNERIAAMRGETRTRGAPASSGDNGPPSGRHAGLTG